MPERETRIQHQEFADNLAVVRQQRILDAAPVRVLKNSNGKLLELVEDMNGSSFVRRTYDDDEVAHIEQKIGGSFEEAWDGMQRMFKGAGIDTVPSFMIRVNKVNEESSVVVVSEYLADAQPVNTASLQEKKKLAKNLATLMHTSNDLLLSPEGFGVDMFAVTDTPEGSRIMLIDVDPYVLKKGKYGKDGLYANYMRKLGTFVRSSWCEEDEKQPFLKAFISGIEPVLDEVEEVRNSEAMMEFSNLHLMSQGVDMEVFQK